MTYLSSSCLQLIYCPEPTHVYLHLFILLGRRDGRPKRKRAPVERLSYENPQVRHRRHREEHYSSEDESIRGKKERVVRRKSARARIRFKQLLDNYTF